MKIAFSVLVAVLCSCATSYAADESSADHNYDTAQSTAADNPYDAEMHKAMEKMHLEMKAMKMSGDIDVDYSTLMAIHHKGALEMAAIQLKYGKNAALKRFNEKLIKDQSAEMKVLQDFSVEGHTR